MIVLPRGGLFIDKKGLEVVLGGGGGAAAAAALEMEFFSRTRDLTPAFVRDGRIARKGEEGGRLPVLFLIYMNPKL